jgi:hypothetical protein
MAKYDSGFQNMNTYIYKTHREKYLPEKIKWLFVAESPPAFKGEIPQAYFYFPEIPKADSLFYTIIKAIYNIDFEKHVHNRTEILTQFCKDGYYLIDSVEYPINKNTQFVEIDNSVREIIIKNNSERFNNHISELTIKGHIVKSTATLLIKETVYNQYSQIPNLNIANKGYIGFPQYVKDRNMIELIRKILNICY